MTNFTRRRFVQGAAIAPLAVIVRRSTAPGESARGASIDGALRHQGDAAISLKPGRPHDWAARIVEKRHVA